MHFNYIKPKNLLEALQILSQASEETRVLAGGTDILVNIQDGMLSPHTLVDIASLEELKQIEEKDGQLELGALVTHSQIAGSERLREKAPPLVQACAEIGSPQIRNLGTLGGNIITASPSGDTVPPLYVLEARLTLKSVKGKRQIPIEQFFTGVKETIIRPEEILTTISFPVLPASSKSFFKKLGQRKALAISKVSVAAIIDIQAGMIKDARIALGAVAPMVIRASQTETVLKGKTLEKDVISQATKIIVTESRAISDIRSTAEYRNEMVGVLLAQVMEEMLEES